MATYYVWSGATGGTNQGTSWTNAYIAFSLAVSAATQSGDVILVHYTHQEAGLGADTTYTFGNHVNVISVDKDNSDAPTAMGTGGWLGDSTNNRFIALNGAFKVYFYGITIRTAGATADEIRLSGSDGSNFEFESVYFWNGNTSTSSYISIGLDASNQYMRFVNCTFRFGSTSQNIAVRGARVEFEGCSIASAGSAPTTLFDDAFGGSNTSGSSPDVILNGCDLSHVTGTLVGSMNQQPRTFRFAQCKLGANVTILATQTPANKSSGAAWVFDCSSGDTHGLFGYYDAFGSCVSDTGVYFTGGAAAQSWKITTTLNCGRYTPFVSPWINLYNASTSAVTPYVEILTGNLGSQIVFKDNEAWAEFAVKTTSGSTQSALFSDRATPLATGVNQSNGAGTGSWTFTAGVLTWWSGKLGAAASITPAESGHIRARVVVGASNQAFFADPQIRT